MLVPTEMSYNECYVASEEEGTGTVEIKNDPRKPSNLEYFQVSRTETLLCSCPHRSERTNCTIRFMLKMPLCCFLSCIEVSMVIWVRVILVYVGQEMELEGEE